GPYARLLEDPRSRGGDKERRGRPGPVAGELEPRRAGAGEGVQVDHGDDIAAERVVCREADGAERAVAAPVAREEDEPVRRLDRALRLRARPGVGPCE